MVVYVIVRKKSVCVGHGSYCTQYVLDTVGSYGTGAFHPIFQIKEEAEIYLSQLEFKSGLEIKEVEVI